MWRKLGWLGLLLLVACGSNVAEDGVPAGTPFLEIPPTEMAEPAEEIGITTDNPPSAFDGNSAFAYLEAQMAFGERWPGSEGHIAVGDYIIQTLEDLNWSVEQQPLEYRNVQGRNIIGKANIGAGPVIILGAHYDTRRLADQTPGGREAGLAVPGAVDGASGVAVLLELARTLNLEETPREVWLAFFDLEDNGSNGLPGWDWIVGSTYMAENLGFIPEAVVVVDMIGDADQQLYYEGNSDHALRETLWQIAGDLGYGDTFITEERHTMIDDHLPFKERGITAVDIIDFDYPYWHTVEDTADKVSAASLLRPGRVLQVWLEEYLD